MPDSLIDQSTFTEPVVSPTPGEDVGTWGSLTKQALQALANRTRFMKNEVDAVTGNELLL